MLKLVTLSALLAVAVAAPQFPIFSPYPFPYFHSPVAVPYTKTAVRPSVVHVPYYYPVPYSVYNPVDVPAPAVVPEPVVATKTVVHPQQTKATFRIPNEPVQPKPAPVESYAPVTVIHSHKSQQQSLDHQAAESPLLNNPSLQLADLILTAEQKRQLEEAVAAMNPLEFAARLEVTKDPREAMRIFDN